MTEESPQPQQEEVGLEKPAEEAPQIKEFIEGPARVALLAISRVNDVIHSVFRGSEEDKTKQN